MGGSEKITTRERIMVGGGGGVQRKITTRGRVMGGGGVREWEYDI